MEKERLEYFIKGLRKESIITPIGAGGQSCGMFRSGIKLIHDDLNFEIKIEGAKSQIKNLNFAMTCFELFLEEFYK